MTMAATLKDYLDRSGFEYELVPHSHTGSSTETAEAAHVSGHHIAKAVMLEDDRGYVMAVLPADEHVHLGHIHQELDRFLGLATESELGDLFPDCERGAVPPVGPAYGVETLLDERVLDNDEVWFEAGDHESLVHMARNDFQQLMSDARVMHFGETGERRAH